MAKRRQTNLNPRSLALLRGEGYVVESVERWAGGVRHDLFGFIDMVACRENEVVFVQVTSRSNASSRRKKILASENHPKVSASGAKILLLTWHQPNGPRTKWAYKKEFVT